MIELFRKNLAINSLLLLPYAILLRIHTLLYPTTTADVSSNGIQEFILSFFVSPLSQNIAATVLVFLQAVFINRIIIVNRISNEFTLLPGLVYIILTSFLPDYSYWSLALVTNTFILIAISRAFKTYKKPKAAALVFDIGMLISISSIIYWPSFPIIIAGYLSLVVLRSVKWQDRIQYLCGLILPYAFWAIYKYVFGDGPNEVLSHLMKITSFKSLLLQDVNNYITISLIFVLVIACLLKYGNLIKKKSIQVQKKTDIFFWILFCVFLGLFWSGFEASHILLLCIPLSYFLSQGFLGIKSRLNAEIIHLAALVMLFLLHFGVIG